MEYKNLATPAACVADFCLIPIGTSSASVSSEVATVQRLLKSSGLSYSMHSAGTTLEGSWEDVTRLIGQAHTIIHKNGVVRIQSDIRIGTRTDKSQSFAEKVSKVESILAADVDADADTPVTTTSPPGKKIPEVKRDHGAVEGSAGKSEAVPGLGPGRGVGGGQGQGLGQIPAQPPATWASMFKK